MRIIALLASCCLFAPFWGVGQTDFKQVYDQSLEQQIKSSVGVGDYWDFYPSWYYSLLHNQYKSRNNENNNLIPIDSMLVHTASSLVKAIQAHNDIDVVYQQELKHWNDRNNDWELSHIETALNELREAIAKMTGLFAEHKVPLEMATVCYNEYERINNHENLISKSHLDNSKKRKAYEACIQEYTSLLNHTYRLNQYCDLASKYELLDKFLK